MYRQAARGSIQTRDKHQFAGMAAMPTMGLPLNDPQTSLTRRP
jgi:hypothetical protein